ncbi:class I adenylate-forming enzyme family protein [Bacillus smithii]|jgi:acyl-CoA synthetase (AMP-forming)/AMP-acid ligase II|uniref:class I adenylate-forming enzyme family protein n=1 Tax=Bacillus smithii TaxID=1479 RepID=UPI002E1F294A|nr:class I adenylate-forming enzyme family protein [Bacillus smithii]MED1457504.1 class I adenylate-forming enzyme family protein [Bacillus smithii]
MEKEPNLLSVYERLVQSVEVYGDKEAIYDLRSRVSYQQLKEDTDRFATVLKNKGIDKGDRVAVSLPNWYETVVIYFAIAKIGAVLVPFNPKYKSYEVEHILKNSEPKIVIASDEFERNFGFEKALIIVSEAITVRFHLGGFPSFDDLIKDITEEATVADIDVNTDLFCILYTSGTTGIPKGVMITHRAVVQSALTAALELRCTKKDVFIVPSPLFHIFGMAINLLCAISVGSRIVLQERFHPQETLKLIEKEKVTIQQGVPTMFIKQLEIDNFDSYDLSTLRAGIVGAAPIPPNKVKEIRKRMGINLCQSFGITEAVTVTATPYDDNEQKIAETLGKAIPGVEIKIVDENRNILPPRKVGEIAIKSFAIMKGYYKMPEQTAKVLDHEGWFYTGDLGTLDEEGYLRFIGRKKEMVIRGGFNIYPQEIESVLSTHPNILESAIIGLPDEVLGEIICAVIRIKNGAECSEEEIKDYLKERMAIYKVPEKVIFTKEFPVTASGKIQKIRLRDQIIEEISRTT